MIELTIATNSIRRVVVAGPAGADTPCWAVGASNNVKTACHATLCTVVAAVVDARVDV